MRSQDEPSFKRAEVFVSHPTGEVSCGEVPVLGEEGFCNDCEDTLAEISPWLTLAQAKAVVQESDTFRASLASATEVRLGRSPVTWLKEGTVNKKKLFMTSVAGVYEGWPSKESFSDDHKGVGPEDLCLAPMEEPDFFGPGSGATVFYLPKRGPCYQRVVTLMDELEHQEPCMARQLYSGQASDTFLAMKDKASSDDRTISILQALRSREDIDKDIEAIASQRLPAAGASTVPVSRQPPCVLTPSVFNSMAARPTAAAGAAPKLSQPVFPRVPRFDPGANFRKPTGSDSSSNASERVLTARDCGATAGAAPRAPPMTPPRGETRRTAASPVSTPASPVIRSPPHSKLRVDPPSSQKGSNTGIMNLADLSGKSLSAALGKDSSVKKPDADAMSVRSTISSKAAKGTLEARFPKAHKNERPLLAYPWTLGLHGLSIKDAKTQVRRVVTGTAGSDPEWHTAAVNHELYLCTSAELNIWRLVENDVSMIEVLLRKLKPVLERVPERNYVHITIRMALEDAPPRKKGPWTDPFFKRILPNADDEEKAGYDTIDPVIWNDFISESDLNDLVPKVLRESLALYVWKPLLLEGQKNHRVITHCASSLVTRLGKLPEKYTKAWTPIAADALAILQMFGDVPFMGGAKAKHVSDLEDEKGPIYQAVLESPYYKAFFDVSQLQSAGEACAWPEVMDHDSRLHMACSGDSRSWNVSTAQEVIQSAIEKWPDWEEQIRDPALKVTLRPNITRALTSLACTIDVQDASQTADALSILGLIRSANAIWKDAKFAKSLDHLQLVANRHAAQESITAFNTSCLAALESEGTEAQLRHLLAIKDHLPPLNSGQRLCLQSKEDRNSAWQCFDLLSARSWVAPTSEEFGRCAEVIELFQNNVETSATDAGFMEILQKSQEKAHVVVAFNELVQANAQYTALGSIPSDRIKSSGSLDTVKHLMAKLDAVAALQLPEDTGEDLKGELNGIIGAGLEASKEHGDHHCKELWPGLAREWDKLKVDSGGGPQGNLWREMLPKEVKDFTALSEKTEHTLQKVETAKLAAQTKSVHLVFSTSVSCPASAGIQLRCT